ncbi:hypothetical protein FK220_010990 [Flavobacteriaceae bacterium TP-CH-4]|uniref:Uncharacterized protein n=1 Tax=Pelagihabitans pacificus TaxID=2696054 RepID=A0A967EDZ9_9FLAO|nr:hypothetical protein [Pelagihabitans pacificus]NHF59868.1 hypothetical protein [Pelagihabitans pacificus]
MDVLNVLIQNSSLQGMPTWYKATTLLLFSLILVTVITSLFILITQGPGMTIRFGY